ncbi:MAG: hypothetical protein V4813_04630 [Gemmatimonadota bacterium]
MTVLRRADLAASVTACRAALRSRSQWLLAGVGMSGFGVGLALTYLRDAVGAPEIYDIAALGTGWSIVLGALAVMMSRTRRIIATHQIFCPSCAHPMIDAAATRTVVGPVDTTVQTGRCSYCGEVSFAA